MKKYIILFSILFTLFFSVTVNAEPIPISVNINNTNLEQPICVWVGHEPTFPVDVDANFWNFTDLYLEGTWESNYMNINDSYILGGFLGTCSSNIDTNGNFIDESLVIETSGEVIGFLDYMVINFDGMFDVEVFYLDYDPSITYQDEVDVYTEFYNSSTDQPSCFFVNDDTSMATDVNAGEYGGQWVYVNGERDGGGWVTTHTDTISVSSFAGTCASNINDNGVVDQAKIVTKEVSFDGYVNVIATEFDGTSLKANVVYQDDYDFYHDEYLEPAPVATAIAISTVTTVASIGVASAIASGTASTVATTVASTTAGAATTATSTATTVASNAMNAPRLQKRFKDRYVKGYKLTAITSFAKKAVIGQEFNMTTKVLKKLSGGKTTFDVELTKLISINPISEGLTKRTEERTDSGVTTTFFLESSFTKFVQVEVRLTIDKKTIIQVFDLPVQQ